MKDKAVVAFKTCPKCGGSGKVPCSGREYYQGLSRQWAESLHGCLVTIPFLKDLKHSERKPNGKRDVIDEWIRVLGIAISYIAQGGWWNLKVYISIDKPPNWGNFRKQYYGFDEDHDIINGHRCYYITKGRPSGGDVIPIGVDIRYKELDITKLLTAGIEASAR